MMEYDEDNQWWENELAGHLRLLITIILVSESKVIKDLFVTTKKGFFFFFHLIDFLRYSKTLHGICESG